jgi:two-component system, OmpR family, alkaline phosphatase synthesis response regulator PhoP
MKLMKLIKVDSMDTFPSNMHDRSWMKEDADLSKKTILVADDEPYLVRVLFYVLKRNGFKVEVANNGFVALKMVRELKPHFVLLDLHLPLLHGLEVVRQIKHDPKLKDTYIIILTAGEDSRDECLAMGADEFMSKPFSVQELVLLIQKQLIQ